MLTIHKFPLVTVQQLALNGPAVAHVPMPRYALPIGAQLQGDAICVWAQVDTDQPMEDRIFHIVGTGQELSLKLVRTSIACGIVQDGKFVWHVLLEQAPDGL